MAANLATSAGFREDTVVPPPDRGDPLGGDGDGGGGGVGIDEEEAQRCHWGRKELGGEWLGSGIFDLPPEERSAPRAEGARRRSIVGYAYGAPARSEVLDARVEVTSRLQTDPPDPSLRTDPSRRAFCTL
jgi:hypothetical protein